AANLSAGTYSVTVTDANNCTVVRNFTLTQPEPVSLIANTNSPVCLNDTLMLYANTAPGATYSWIGPDGYNTTTREISRLSAQSRMAGVYTVMMNACDLTLSTTVSV